MRVAAAGKFPYLGAETQADRMDGTDKKLLNLLQTEVPIAPRPWGEVGERLGGVGEAEVMERVRALKAAKIIRQISAIFDTRSLGYESSLVAAQYDSARVDRRRRDRQRAPRRLAQLPAQPRVQPLVHHRSQPRLAARSGADGAGSPRNQRRAQHAAAADAPPVQDRRRTRRRRHSQACASRSPVGYTHKDRKAADTSLTELEIRFVREMQKDLAIEPEPFVATASRLGVSLEELQRTAAAMIENGRMRRFSAVLRHREVGFTANAMGVWVARGTDAEILAAGEKMAGFRAVTHCYRRPTYPDWPYNLFTMVHGRTPAECEAVLAEISKETGITDYAALYSTKEWKKVRVEYFTDGHDRKRQDAPIQRRAAPSRGRVHRQRHGRLDRARHRSRDSGRGREDGRLSRGDALLSASDLPRLAVQPVYDGPWPHAGGVRRRFG